MNTNNTNKFSVNSNPIKIGEFEPGSVEWLNLRKEGIGGSDAGRITHVNPFESAHELWADKTDTSPVIPWADPSASVAVQIGTFYEPIVGQLFVKKMEAEGHTVELVIDKATFRCGEPMRDEQGLPVVDEVGEVVLRYPFLMANIDGLPIIDGERCLLEIKTTTAWNFDVIRNWKAGIVPAHYVAQVRHYMAVMNINTAYIICCWGLGPDDNVIVKLNRNATYEKQYIEMAERFWDCVKERKEPSCDGEIPDLLQKYWSHMNGKNEKKATLKPKASKELDSICEELASLQAARIKAEEELKETVQAEQTLINEFVLATGAEKVGNVDIEYIGTNQRCYVNGKEKTGRSSIKEATVKELHPELIDRGMKFDGTTLKRSLEAEAQKSDCSEERKEEIATLIKEITTEGEAKGGREYKVAFYEKGAK